MTAKALAARAEAWRPWRGYATLQLWREAMAVPAATHAKRVASQRGEVSPMASRRGPLRRAATRGTDRTSVVWGTGESGRCEHGGHRRVQNTKNEDETTRT